MDTKKKKLAQVDELVVNLGLARDEVIDYFTKLPPVKEPKKSRPKIDITQVKVGMIWYEDDTFSFDILPKKIKAIVELVEYTTSTVCGDLTASDLFNIKEQLLSWDEAIKYLDNFSYPCKKNERIIWYSAGGIRDVYDEYPPVEKAFSTIGKKCRNYVYWTGEETTAGYAWCLDFRTGKRGWEEQNLRRFVRPVLELTVE